MTDLVIDVPVLQGPPGPVDFLMVFEDLAAGRALGPADLGKVLRVNSASPVTLTLPATLPVGWNCHVIQAGAGRVTLEHATGGPIRRIQGTTSTLVQEALVSVACERNTGGSAAEYRIWGAIA